MQENSKIGVIDIGSNSIVLLLADLSPDGRITPENEFYAITKLGSNVKNAGCMSEEAISHTILAVKEMKEIASKEGVTDLVVTATSAVRKANNRNRFLVRCHEEFGIFPQVLSGKEEARYTYLGATHGFVAERPFVTIDIGGGSTEVSWGRSMMIAGHSIDAGCVSLCRMFDLSQDFSLYKRISASRFLRKEFAKFADDLKLWLGDRSPMVIASGGTVTTFAAIYHQRPAYDREKIHATKGHRKDVAAMSRSLGRMDLHSRRRLPGMDRDRAEELPAGLLILTEFLRYFQFKRFLVSTNGLRTGIVKNYAATARI
ncbi:MAG: hypothetical protein JW808_02135 [Victivallales bacterium]|nr:hypothetical protein [Victivallales bacterium]